MRHVRRLGAVLLLVLCATETLVAQQDDNCVDCTNYWVEEWKDEDQAGWGHTAADARHDYAGYSRGGGTHPTVVYPFTCSANHAPPCREGGADPGPLYDDDFDYLLDSTLASIKGKLRDGDAIAALRIVLDQPAGSPIRVAPERAAIQVRACDERYIAVHIPIEHLATPEDLAAVAAVLEGSRAGP